MYHIQKEDTRMSLMGKMGDWQVSSLPFKVYEGDAVHAFTFPYKWELSLIQGSFFKKFSRQ